MFLSIRFKKEFIYILYFIPLCLLKLVFNKGIKEKILILSTESFSKILLITFYFYQIIRYRKENQELFIKNKMNNTKFLFIFFSIIYFTIFLYLEYFNLNDLNGINFENLSILLVDLIFFKKQIYSHHILSILLAIIPFLIFFISYNIYKSLNIFFIFIIKNYCQSFSLLLIKYINTIYFTNIYLLGSLIGLFSFIFQFIYFNILEIKRELIVYLIICFILDILFYYIILKLDAIHSILCYQLSFFFINILSKKSLFNKIEFIIIIFFEIISCFIYVEIIELNCFGLNKNIKDNISLRSIIETNKITEINNKLPIKYSNIYELTKN